MSHSNSKRCVLDFDRKLQMKVFKINKNREIEMPAPSTTISIFVYN